MRHFTLAAIATLLLTATPLHAATYYVSTTGNDANLGTIDQPFLTINQGVKKLAPGDQLYVRGGTYNQSVLVYQKHGIVNGVPSPIRINTYGTEVVIIDGTGITQNSVVGISRSSYIYFEDFIVRNGPAMGIFMYDSNNIKVRYNEVHTNQTFGIHAASASASAWGTSHHIVIADNKVYNNVLANKGNNNPPSGSGGWAQALSAMRSDHVDIIDNYVYENYGEGIDLILTDNGLIQDNKLWDNFSTNIYLDNAQFSTVDGNRVSCGSNTAFYRDGSPGGGISTANESYPDYGAQNPLDSITVKNNIVLRCHYGFNYRNSEEGGGLHNTVIANNVFYSTTYATIWIKDADDGTHVHDTTLIANNILYQKYDRPYASSPTVGITFQNNVWYGGGDPTTIINGPGDLTSDPMLVNAGGSSADSYKLQAGSPCIDAGTYVSQVDKDYFTTVRAGRGAAWDIGIHEY